MTLQIDLTPDIRARLEAQASRLGLETTEYARKLIEENLPKPNQSTLELFRKWEKEDATDDPQEIERRNREAEEFMQNLARNRIEMEGSNARRLWP